MYDCHAILRQRIESVVRAECAQMDGFSYCSCFIIFLCSYYNFQSRTIKAIRDLVKFWKTSFFLMTSTAQHAHMLLSGIIYFVALPCWLIQKI